MFLLAVVFHLTLRFLHNFYWLWGYFSEQNPLKLCSGCSDLSPFYSPGEETEAQRCLHLRANFYPDGVGSGTCTPDLLLS